MGNHTHREGREGDWYQNSVHSMQGRWYCRKWPNSSKALRAKVVIYTISLVRMMSLSLVSDVWLIKARLLRLIHRTKLLSSMLAHYIQRNRNSYRINDTLSNNIIICTPYLRPRVNDCKRRQRQRQADTMKFSARVDFALIKWGRRVGFI